jgi:8-oxo-dGTP diphosphatase
MEYVYEAPVLTVDAVIFQLINNELNVLLIKRNLEPFKDTYALPGGYNPKGETTMKAFERVLSTKAGIKKDNLQLIEQLYTFDTVARDPRGHAVSIAYMGLTRDPKIKESSDTEDPKFFPITKLPKLAFDHESIIKYAHERLSSKITYTNAIFALLPKQFTLTQLQQAYEAVLCRELDKRNFRKRIMALNLLKPTSKYFTEGAHRPALIYSFQKQGLETSPQLID